MSKTTGKGGSITIDAVKRAGVIDYSWEEVGGIIRGQESNNLSANVSIESGLDLLRVGDESTWALDLGTGSGKTATLLKVRITSQSVDVNHDILRQTVTAESHTTATIA